MTQDRSAVVRSFLEALEAGKDEDALALVSDKATYRINAWQEPITGRDALRAELERQATIFSGLRIEVLAVAEGPDVVVTERIDRMEISGKPVQIHAVGVFGLDGDDKITDWRDYFDMKEIESQLAG